MLWAVVALVLLSLVTAATVTGAAARAITVAHCVSRRCEWVGVVEFRVAIDAEVEVIKAPEGEGKWCGGCLGTSVGSRVVKLSCGAVALQAQKVEGSCARQQADSGKVRQARLASAGEPQARMCICDL